MPELALRPQTAAALSAEAARLGAALAALLDELPDAHAEAFADASAFLRRMAATRGPSPATRADAEAFPLDRLTAALGLSDLERDAVVLAGMPEEHEGYAGVL